MARVLVVDDDRMLLKCYERVLRRHHHRVRVMASPRDALDLLLTGEPFDVVILDQDMPGLTGSALHDALRHTRPEVADRVVFVSGWCGASDWAWDRPVLTKPFQVEDLLQLVREVAAGASV